MNDERWHAYITTVLPRRLEGTTDAHKASANSIGALGPPTVLESVQNLASTVTVWARVVQPHPTNTCEHHAGDGSVSRQ